MKCAFLFLKLRKFNANDLKSNTTFYLEAHKEYSNAVIIFHGCPIQGQGKSFEY